MYKILNGHTTPNLKEVFLFNKERANTCNLRNKETDLDVPIPKKEFGKRCFNYKGPYIGIIFPTRQKLYFVNSLCSRPSWKSAGCWGQHEKCMLTVDAAAVPRAVYEKTGYKDRKLYESGNLLYNENEWAPSLIFLCSQSASSAGITEAKSLYLEYKQNPPVPRFKDNNNLWNRDTELKLNKILKQIKVKLIS